MSAWVNSINGTWAGDKNPCFTAEGAIRPGRHFEGTAKKKKGKEKKEKKERREERKKEKREKKKIWMKHVITLKLKWNI